MHPILLSTERVYALLKENHCETSYKLHFFSSLDSTNTFVKTLPIDNNIAVCCAETQTQGRGRFGRTWHSPPAENIYCSVRWPFQSDLSRLSSLGLIISLALMQTLKALGIHEDIGIKWPNDILWKGKKISGILIEIQADSPDSLQAVIGIGMNINTDTEKHTLPDKEWASLLAMTGKLHDRNEILAILLIQLEKHIKQFAKDGLKPFLAEWDQYDLLKGQTVTVMQNRTTIQGQSLGIDENGALKLQDTQGQIHILTSGDTSLKSLTG